MMERERERNVGSRNRKWKSEIMMEVKEREKVRYNRDGEGGSEI
jgi:hypothetical protein